MDPSQKMTAWEGSLGVTGAGGRGEGGGIDHAPHRDCGEVGGRRKRGVCRETTLTPIKGKKGQEPIHKPRKKGGGGGKKSRRKR